MGIENHCTDIFNGNAKVSSDLQYLQNNEKIIRSASAAAQSKCIIFLFADWDVSDCFCGKVDAIDLKER